MSYKHYFITGSIGVGKSYTIENVMNLLNNKNITVIKEYIDYDPMGYNMLKKWHNNEINTYQFQNYILDQFIYQLENSNNNIFIWERHPIETIDIFCENSKDLKAIDKVLLLKKCDKFFKQFNIPCEKLNNIHIIYINPFEDNYISNCFTYIHNYLTFYPEKSLIIYLGINPLNFSRQIDNIKKRNRQIEIDKYMNNKGLNSLFILNYKYHCYWLYHMKNSLSYIHDFNILNCYNHKMIPKLENEIKEYTTCKPNYDLLLKVPMELTTPYFGSGSWWQYQ